MGENTVYGCLAEKVKANPSAIAILEKGRSLTYNQLDQRIDEIAGHFPSEIARIGIVTDHGVDMIAAILAVLKTGAAYIPAEPDFPEERIRFMMRESNVGCIITQKKYKDRLNGFPLLFLEDIPDHPIEQEIPYTATPDSVAYVLYTSGSTGVPKGVVITNSNICHYVRAFQREFHPVPGDIMLQYSVCSFDIFVEEVFATLLSGATLAIPPAQVKASTTALMEFVQEMGVTIISGFPYLLLEMNKLERIPDSLRLLISGGDVLRENYITNLLSQVEIYNTYGPSETTVCTTYFHCNGQKALDDGTYPIGKAILGTTVELLGDDMRPVSPGSIGEICISGGGVANGYLGNRENEVFVTTPDGTHIYRSGDLGRLLPDGDIAFLRRKDMQVMILGKRVEPDEVENVLCRCEEVQAGVVRPFTDENGLSYFTAYIVPANDQFSLSAVKKKMSQFLTSFMIPEYFVLLDHIPLTPNGKLDIQKLPVVLKAGELLHGN